MHDFILREKKSQKLFVVSYPNIFLSLLSQLGCYLYNFISIIYTTNCYKTISYGSDFQLVCPKNF